MPRGATSLRFMRLRALIILGALVSLCVSNNVGPRLLPLPSPSENAAAAGQVSLNTTASRLPSQDGTNAVRVAIAAPANKRAGADTSPQPLAGAAPQGGLVTPRIADDSARFVYSPHLINSRSVSRPRGRAPPLSV